MFHSFAFEWQELTEIEEVRKSYISFLGKLALAEPEEVEGWKIQAIQTLILAIAEVSYSYRKGQKLMIRNDQLRMLLPVMPSSGSKVLSKNDSQIN